VNVLFTNLFHFSVSVASCSFHWQLFSSIITNKCTFLYFCYTFPLHMFRLWSSHRLGYTSRFTSLALVHLAIITRRHNVLVFAFVGYNTANWFKMHGEYNMKIDNYLSCSQCGFLIKFQIIKFIGLLYVLLQILSQRVQSAKRVRKRFLDSDENNQVSGAVRTWRNTGETSKS
jgi:hypothetical protein